MGSSDERYFLLGGAMSLGMFLLTLMLFASVLFTHDRGKQFAFNQADFIAVSIEVPLHKASRQHTKTPAPIAREKPAAEAPAPAPQVTQDVSSLFDNVWTQDLSAKKTVKKKAEDTSKRLSALEKRIKTTESTQSTQAADTVRSLKLARPSVAVTGSAASAAAEVNEYYAKIQALIYDQFYPPANSEGNTAKVYLSLDGTGRLLSGKILVDSGNPFFDEEVEALMRRLEAAAFPAPPGGRALELQIILTAEE